jgi:pre-mRNA-splicing factor SYF1
VYEKGVDLFQHPHVLPIWVAYLRKFIGRYKGTKVERTRDLFEQAVSIATLLSHSRNTITNDAL